jgi:hypothetical protein
MSVAPSSARDRRLDLTVLLVSLAIILLEINYTRIFSYKLVYYFTYVIIGIALLGLGGGGVLVAMFPRLRRSDDRVTAVICCAGGVGVLASYLAVSAVQVNSVDLVLAVASGEAGTALVEGGKLLLTCLALFVPFLSGGLAIAVSFAVRHARINRLYFADLLGAGLGCALAVPVMTQLTPPGGVLLAGALFATAALPLAGDWRRGLSAMAAVTGGCLALAAAFAGWFPDPVPDRIKTMSPQQRPTVLFTSWSPVFRIDVLEVFGTRDTGLVLSHDGTWGSVILRFDGDPTSLTRYATDARAYPFRLLGAAPRVAIIGAAGGNEILAALHFGAAHITAVELNPVTVSLLRDHFADYTGNVATHERVTLVNAEGRSFLASTPDRFDLIWFVAPDSYAAMNAATSGAYVLSESYLYTEEMIADSLRHLTDDGIVCAQFGERDFERKPNRTTRYLTTARQAFARLGIDAFARHVLVSTVPFFDMVSSTIVLKRTPFTAEEAGRCVAATANIKGGQVRFAQLGEPAQGSTGAPTPVRSAITAPSDTLATWLRDQPFDVRPVTDDAPFFWHFVRFRTALGTSADLAVADLEEGMGERLLLILLVVVTMLGAVFLLAPLLARRALWRSVPHKRNAAIYFAALGLGFMFLEVCLIQRLTLLLGYPTYSLTVTLFALLVFTGVGSLGSEQAMAHRNRTLVVLLALLAALVVCLQMGLPAVVRLCVGWPLPLRVAVAVAVVAPAGPVPGTLHATRPAHGGGPQPAPRRVRRLGVGRERLPVGGEHHARRHRGHDLRLHRRDGAGRPRVRCWRGGAGADTNRRQPRPKALAHLTPQMATPPHLCQKGASSI